jgi:hypothetical protein
MFSPPERFEPASITAESCINAPRFVQPVPIVISLKPSAEVAYPFRTCSWANAPVPEFEFVTTAPSVEFAESPISTVSLGDVVPIPSLPAIKFVAFVEVALKFPKVGVLVATTLPEASVARREFIAVALKLIPEVVRPAPNVTPPSN